MNWLTDEFLFYGGLICAGVLLFAGIISFCVIQMKLIRLNAKLDSEYGTRQKLTDR